MSSRPIAAQKLAVTVNVRLHGSSRVFEPAIQPVLSEEPEKMHASHHTYGVRSRDEIRSEPMANAALDTPARIVPIEVHVEPQITTGQEIAVDVTESEIGIDP